MTAKKATTPKKSSKASSTASKKASATASASAKHAAHVAHVAHVAHLAHLAAIGQSAPVTVKATPAAPAKATKAVSFGIGDWLPVCGFEAVAQSLRLAGQFVHDDEVAGLWDLLGAPPLGASLAAVLDAAGEHGLAGLRPRWEQLERLGPVRVADEPRLPRREDDPAPLGPFENFLAGDAHGLILRIDVPGPHAVLATPDGWWSWSELYDPWRCQVSEAWAVSWEALPAVGFMEGHEVFQEIGGDREAVSEGEGCLDARGIFGGQLGFKVPGEGVLAELDGVPLADLGFIKGNALAHAPILGAGAR